MNRKTLQIEDAAKNDLITSKFKELLKIYHTPLGYIFLRKIFKIPIMCILYSLTEEGFAQHINRKFRETLEESKFIQFKDLEDILLDEDILDTLWKRLYNI
jgi:hypothetical protein